MTEKTQVSSFQFEDIDTFVAKQNTKFWRMMSLLMVVISNIFAVQWAFLGSSFSAIFCATMGVIALFLHIVFRLGLPVKWPRAGLRILLSTSNYVFAAGNWDKSTATAFFFILIPICSIHLGDRKIAQRWLILGVLAVISFPMTSPYFHAFAIPDQANHDVIILTQIIIVMFLIYYVSVFNHRVNRGLISNLSHVNQELKFTHNALLEAQKLKDRFFASISHEIRTPMNAVQGIAQLLQHASDKNRNVDQDLIRDLRRASNHLLGVLNDLLDFGRLNEGKLILRPSLVDLKKICDEVISIIRHDADAKGLNVKLNFDEKLPRFIYIDGIRLRQIIVNIVNNAVKFTDEGAIHIRYDLLKSDKGHDVLQVSVQDWGMGIPEQLKPKIFEGYEQGDSRAHRRYAGSGLGLSICKHILEMQNGRIWFDSELGQGTTFFIQLPLHVMDEALTEPSMPLMRIPPFKTPQSILIVDDNDLNVTIIEKLLKSVWPDIFISVAKNGHEAIDAVIKNQPDVILMDLYMPDMDGFEAAQRIRDLEDFRLSYTPIIAMSANLPDLEIKKAMQSGVNDYVTKPFVVQHLVDKIIQYNRF